MPKLQSTIENGIKSFRIIMGLTGDDTKQEYSRGIETQADLTYKLITKGGPIPGLESVPNDHRNPVTIYVNHQFNHKFKNHKQEEVGFPGKTDSIVIDICGHHEPKDKDGIGGFRKAHHSDFYKIEEIAEKLANLLSDIDFDNLHIILHSCETATKSSDSTENKSTMQELIDAILSQPQIIQKELKLVSIYGVRYELSENSAKLQLWEQNEKKKRVQLKGGGFENITIATQSAESHKATSQSTPITSTSIEEADTLVQSGAQKSQ